MLSDFSKNNQNLAILKQTFWFLHSPHCCTNYKKIKAFESTFLKPFDANDLQDLVCSSFGKLTCKKFCMLDLEFTWLVTRCRNTWIRGREERSCLAWTALGCFLPITASNEVTISSVNIRVVIIIVESFSKYYSCSHWSILIKIIFFFNSCTYFVVAKNVIKFWLTQVIHCMTIFPVSFFNLSLILQYMYVSSQTQNLQ